jgi:hypothetical protein
MKLEMKNVSGQRFSFFQQKRKNSFAETFLGKFIGGIKI